LSRLFEALDWRGDTLCILTNEGLRHALVVIGVIVIQKTQQSRIDPIHDSDIR
jgi:hypothetical protein